MIGCIIIVSIGILLMILSNLLFPELKIKNLVLGTYWIITLITALILIIFGFIDLPTLGNALIANTSMNPLKILVLFLSMTMLSIFLDEIGFFAYIALKVSSKLQSNQKKLFVGLYALISILTVFTSNDIIILTFTPFICYFCKHAKIKPLPYLISEFVAANTWSMFLIIGNPTNIYLASSFDISFFEYIKVMFLPTLVSSLLSFSLLMIIFRKALKEPLCPIEEEITAPNKFLCIVGLCHLFITTILLAISSYIGLEMWYITLAFAISELIFVIAYSFKNRDVWVYINSTVKRIPWAFVPFLLSMFTIVLSLSQNGITEILHNFFMSLPPFVSSGLFGTLIANIINNIPMSVLYSSILTGSSTEYVYHAIMASNIAAFITPLGALAGIMFMRLLKKHDIELRFIDFVRYGCLVGIPTLLVGLATLSLLFL